jgi:hypothetical protein
MGQLQHSVVWRGGVTARDFSGKTQTISSDITPHGLEIAFELPSKGGGTTYISLTVGRDDLRSILKELATKLPTLADSLADAAHVAIVSYMKAGEAAPEAKSHVQSGR